MRLLGQVLCCFSIISSLLFLSSAAKVQDDSIGCYVEGECLDSQLLTVQLHIPDPVRCSETCNDYNGCLFFTHHQVNLIVNVHHSYFAGV